MHRRSEVELLPLDTEIEKTLRNLKKVREVEKAAMTEQREVNHNIPIATTGVPQ